MYIIINQMPLFRARFVTSYIATDTREEKHHFNVNLSLIFRL